MSKDYHFRVYGADLQNFLDIHSNVSEFIRDTLDKLRTGQLVENGSGKSLKDQKLEQEILHLKLKNQLELKTQHGKSIDEIKKIMENPDLFQVEDARKGLPCPECDWGTLETNTVNEQINQLTWHVKHFHHRSLTEDEADKLSRLLV